MASNSNTQLSYSEERQLQQLLSQNGTVSCCFTIQQETQDMRCFGKDLALHTQYPASRSASDRLQSYLVPLDRYSLERR